MEDMDDNIQANLSDLFRRHLQEITPQARTMDNITPDFANFNPHPPGAEASVAGTRANEARDTTQESNTKENNHSFLFANARFGGNDETYNGTNQWKKESNKKQRRDEEDEFHPSDQNPGNNNDNEESGEESTLSISGHFISHKYQWTLHKP